MFTPGETAIAIVEKVLDEKDVMDNSLSILVDFPVRPRMRSSERAVAPVLISRGRRMTG